MRCVLADENYNHDCVVSRFERHFSSILNSMCTDKIIKTDRTISTSRLPIRVTDRPRFRASVPRTGARNVVVRGAAAVSSRSHAERALVRHSTCPIYTHDSTPQSFTSRFHLRSSLSRDSFPSQTRRRLQRTQSSEASAHGALKGRLRVSEL